MTDRDGTYRIAQIPAGEHSVTVSYTGMDSVSRKVTVRAEQSAVVDFELSTGTVKLETFEVSTEREGNADAINHQKRGESQRNVASADAFGDIPMKSRRSPLEHDRHSDGIYRL